MTQKEIKTIEQAGRAAFAAYCKTNRTSTIERAQDYTITDTIVALMYFAKSRKQDPLALLRSAQDHYTAERYICATCPGCGRGLTADDLEARGTTCGRRKCLSDAPRKATNH